MLHACVLCLATSAWLEDLVNHSEVMSLGLQGYMRAPLSCCRGDG